MNLDEIASRINNIRTLEELERKPVLPYDPSDSMETLEEAKSYIRFLYEQLQEMKSERADLKTLLEEVRLDLKEARKQMEKKDESESRLLSNIERLMRDLSDSRTENARLCVQNKVLLEEIQVLKKYRYGSPSQRNRRSKDAENRNVSEKTPRDRAEEKDDFDGTNGCRPIEDGTDPVQSEEKHNSGTDPARKGSKFYNIERQVKGKPWESVLAVRQEKSESIKKEIRKELDYLKSQLKLPSDDLLTKAVHYMDTFWEQLFLYLKDGRYTIDNLAAERAIRPLAVERNNSMFFCSHKGAETSVLYHTIIATCKKQGYKVLDYLKEFFKQIILGRCDYENLMPSTIGIRTINKR